MISPLPRMKAAWQAAEDGNLGQRRSPDASTPSFMAAEDRGSTVPPVLMSVIRHQQNDSLIVKLPRFRGVFDGFVD